MVQIILFLVLISICIFSKKEVILYLFALFLPFHAFVKGAMDYIGEGGEIFAFWKEVAVVIFLYKAVSGKPYKFSRRLILLISCFFILIFCYYFLSNDFKTSLASLRNHIFPIL